ncbi:MAG: 4Fe-4S binding protein [Desulfobacterales bacterium]
MKIIRKIIEIDEELCDGCGQCVPNCAEGALKVVDGKVKVIADNLCDGLGACLGECPQGALKIIEREAEDFDETAVAEHLTRQGSVSTTEKEAETLPRGCPSAQIQTFSAPPAAALTQPPSGDSAGEPSALTHWPIKIRLVPPTAPYLKGADLLILADCAATAYRNLHQDLLAGKVVMMGCPKFDDAALYVERLTQVFQTAGIKRVTCVRMEVPCCSGLTTIIQKALKAANQAIPVEELVISPRGNVVETISLAA